ncbi:hypothetical protein ACUY4R_002107 [Kosakonia sp. BK9b]|uniref:hypothetical protein n=1 Tax=Kosakonia sp. TaxID=1916651 RepID=UPI002898A2F3|nr:hypothetical protein [Kosakonia sp.]
MARNAPFCFDLILKMEKYKADLKKTALKYGFFENKKIYSANLKRCAEFRAFL